MSIAFLLCKYYYSLIVYKHECKYICVHSISDFAVQTYQFTIYKIGSPYTPSKRRIYRK